MKFEEIYWHDSVIKNLKIDRAAPGHNDTVEFEMDWYDRGGGKLIFDEVYWLHLDMNFGTVAQETILMAECSSDRGGGELANFYKKWKGMLDEVNLSLYTIELNSTGGKISIIAKSFQDKITTSIVYV